MGPVKPKDWAALIVSASTLLAAVCFTAAVLEAQYSIGSSKRKRGGGGISSAPVTNETWLPTVFLTAPNTGPLGGASVTVEATAADTGSGVASVSFYWIYCPAGCTGQVETLIGTDTTSPYSYLWTFPACGPYPEDRFSIRARAIDVVGNVSTTAGVDVRLTGRGC
jgi:hypothetical protein